MEKRKAKGLDLLQKIISVKGRSYIKKFMEQLLVALSPFFVSAITEWIKKIKSIALNKKHKGILRLVAGFFSLVAAVAIYFSGDAQLDENAIQIFMTGLITFLGSQGVFFLGKKKEDSMI